MAPERLDMLQHGFLLQGVAISEDPGAAGGDPAGRDSVGRVGPVGRVAPAALSVRDPCAADRSRWVGRAHGRRWWSARAAERTGSPG